MLDSIYHMTLKLTKNHILGVKTSRFSHLLRNVIMDFITLRRVYSRQGNWGTVLPHP